MPPFAPVALLLLSLVMPLASPAWAQSADFDDAEAQLQVRQAATAASAAARRVDALRKDVETERQRIIQTDSERDLNQAALQGLERELKAAEARQRELDAALKTAQDARTRGLALRPPSPSAPAPPATSAPPASEDQERAKAAAEQKQRDERDRRAAEEERRKKEATLKLPVPATGAGPAANTVPPEIAWALGRWTGTIDGCCNDSTTRNLQVSWIPGAAQCGWSVANRPPVGVTSGCAVSLNEIRLTTSLDSIVVLRRAGAALAGTITLRNGKSFALSMARDGMAPRPLPNVASAAPGRASTWTAVARLIVKRSASTCDEEGLRLTLAFDGSALEVTINNTKVLIAQVPGDGMIREPFRSPNGGRLELSGNVKTRDLEVARSDHLCRWKLAPG